MKLAVALGMIAAMSVGRSALADEQMIPLVESGDWVALEHRPSMTDPPDVCMSANTEATVLLRGDGTTVDIRSSNDAWSLPDSVQGNVVLVVSADTYSFDIDYNTDSMVSATVAADKVQALLDDMAKADSLTLKIGKGVPIAVSLSGSTKTLNAFRTCDGLGGGGSGGGTNPFN